jgi:hypothetical protein
MDLVVGRYLRHCLTPRIASRATRALDAAEWLRLRFLMDLCPPVAILPRQKSTYTPVRESAAASLRAPVPSKVETRLTVYWDGSKLTPPRMNAYLV